MLWKTLPEESGRPVSFGSRTCGKDLCVTSLLQADKFVRKQEMKKKKRVAFVHSPFGMLS